MTNAKRPTRIEQIETCISALTEIKDRIAVMDEEKISDLSICEILTKEIVDRYVTIIHIASSELERESFWYGWWTCAASGERSKIMKKVMKEDTSA